MNRSVFMDKRAHLFFKRLVTMVLCMAMLTPALPSFAAVAKAAEETAETETVATDSVAEATETSDAEAADDMYQTSLLADWNTIKITDGIYVPAYSGGTTSQVLAYDCGNGITNNGEKSYLVIVTGTHSSQFLAYKSTLEAGSCVQLPQ